MALYSHSRLSTFEQCPLKYRLHYIDKVKPDFETTIEAFMGSLVHDVLQKLYNDLKFQKMNSLPELLNFFNTLWNERFNENIDIVKKEYSPDNYKKMGEKFITDYYNSYKPFNESKTVGLETQYTAKLNEQHRIHIRIDRLAIKEGVFEVHDYKTSNTLPTQEKIDNDRQLAVYSYGLKQMYPSANKIKLVWHYLAFNKEMVGERTDKQLQEMRNQILELIKGIELCTEFLPKKSALCDWCQYRSKCPNFKHLYHIEKSFLDDGALLADYYGKISTEISEKEQELEKIRKNIIEFAEKNNIEIVYGQESKVSVKFYPKMSFPGKNDPEKEQFYTLIKNLGLWEKLAIVDVYELAKMINNQEIHSELLKLLDNYIKKDKRAVLRVGKR